MMVSNAGKRHSNPMHFRFWRSPDLFDYAKKGPQTAQTSRWFAAHKGRLCGQNGPSYRQVRKEYLTTYGLTAVLPAFSTSKGCHILKAISLHQTTAKNCFL